MRPILAALSALTLAPALVACAQPDPAPETQTPAAPAQDAFLSELQTKYPATLSKVGDSVWVHTTNYTVPGQAPIPVNGLVVKDGEAITLVDAAWGELATVALIKKIEAETGLPVTKLVTTHHHADRTGGVDAAEMLGLEIFTHPNTPKLAFEAGFPVPNTSVAMLKDKGARTKVGAVEIAYPGPAHASDNLVVYIPSEKILYAGCAVRGGGSTTLGNVVDADMESWGTSLNWLKATYPETVLVVPGHGKGGNLLLIDATLALLSEADAAP